MLEDNRIRIFLAVVDCGSFTAAAIKLHITQPAVSQNIAELERILGTQLMDRARGEISLTENGHRFEGYARQIAHWYDVANKAFNPDPLTIHPKAVEPVRLRLDDGSEAEVWTSGKDIHIELK